MGKEWLKMPLQQTASHGAKPGSERPDLTPWPSKEPSKEQWERELAFAGRVQTALLEASSVAAWSDSVQGLSVPHFIVGGDYFDVFSLPDGRLRMLVADVMGKGFGAAMLMTMFRGIVRAASLHCTSPGALLKQANDLLYEDLQEMGSFITASCADYEPGVGAVTVASAGHPYPLFLHQGAAEADWLKVRGIGLGMLPDRAYQEHQIEPSAGDLMVLYTDGIIEARDSQNRELGAAGLQRLVIANREAPVPELLQSVLSGVAVHTAGVGPRDDVTLVAFRFRGVG